MILASLNFNTIDSLTSAHNSGLRKISGKSAILNSSRNDVIGVEASITWLNVDYFKLQKQVGLS